MANKPAISRFFKIYSVRAVMRYAARSIFCFFNRASRWISMHAIMVKKEYRFLPLVCICSTL